MTNYPYGFDNNITLPGVSGSTQEDSAITALRSAVFAIEIELGITPSGIYPDVRTRLDILESRLQFGVSPNIPNDGYVKSPLFIWNVPENVVLSISDGYGVPTENRLNGSLFMRSDGYANAELYVRRNGAWFPMQSDLWMAGGDLKGTYLTQEVIGIRNKPLSSSLELVGSTQDGYHLTWDNLDGYWRAETGFIASADLAPAPGSLTRNTGRTAQTVVRLQGNNIATGVPTDGYAFIWETADNHWDFQPLAVVFHNSSALGDGYVTRRNIRSNRILQSPSTNAAGLIGMTNLGSSTDGSGGASSNYASILGGDRNTASGLIGYPLVVNGFANIASDGYSSVLNGNANLASAMYATVLSGTNNSASAVESFILDGYSNSATALNSFVLNGGSNQAKANFSGILNGISNMTVAGATHSGIGWGQFNTINAGGISSVIIGGSANQASGVNEFIGTPTGANVSSNFTSVINGINHTIGAGSDHSIILSGNTHTVSASSGFGFIGAGNNLTVTGLYATILNSTGGLANGLHSLVLNGNTNQVTASFSTIGNGNNNTISGAGATAYATILDGYQNVISGAGSFIGDGYNQSISGQFSSILNGNNNSIAGLNSTILNGSFNTADSASFNNVVLGGNTNAFTNSSRVMLLGNGNIINNTTSAYILGQFNNVQSISTKITGDSNTVSSGSSFVRVFGNNNTVGTGSTTVTQTTIFGASNIIAPTSSTHDNFCFGSNNIIDGYGTNIVLGSNNIGASNFGLVFGQYGKSRLFGQQVQSSGRFTTGKIGEVQWSRVVLDGYAASGGAIQLQLQDTTLGFPTNLSFVDGYSYDLQIRVLIVNTSLIPPNPVVPARFVIDILMHQEAGVLVIDNVNRTTTTPQASGTNWTVSVSGDGLAAPVNNQLVIQVDTEAGPPYVQPSNSPSARRAVATVEMREISRL